MSNDVRDLATIATFYRRVQWAALALGVLWVVWLLAPILSPFVFAALLGWLGDPLVDRLEARGWLERRLSPQDRRARQLFLTPAGEQGLADTVPAMLRAQEQILAPLTPRQRTEFMRLLLVLVTQNNDLSRAPAEVAGR